MNSNVANNRKPDNVRNDSCEARASYAGLQLTGNVFKNNVLDQSRFLFLANDTRWTWYTQTLSQQPCS